MVNLYISSVESYVLLYLALNFSHWAYSSLKDYSKGVLLSDDNR